MVTYAKKATSAVHLRRTHVRPSSADNPNKQTCSRSDQLHPTHVCVGAAMVNDRRSLDAIAVAVNTAYRVSIQLAGQHRAGVPTLAGRAVVIRTGFESELLQQI